MLSTMLLRIRVLAKCTYPTETSQNEEGKMKIAVSGKGGVGKTLVAGGLANSFASSGFKVIAFDADPSPNLALTLGLSIEEARKILPISENKELIESKTDTGYSGVYRLSFDVGDIIRDYSIMTPFNVNLIVMGSVKSMGSGCTCPANAVVRSLLKHLVVERDEVVIMDMEAGIEHIGRGTAKHVDIMLIVSDANMKALETAKHIHELASAANIKRVFLIGNRISSEAQRGVIEEFAVNNGMRILAFVPFDSKVVEAEMRGVTPLKLEKSEALQAIETMREKLTAKNFS